MKRNSKKIVWSAFLLLIGIAFSTEFFLNGEALGKTYDRLKVFAEVLSKVERNYVEPVEIEDLVKGAINGMLRTLDPHSSYMSEDMYKEMKVETEGEFGGLGIEITLKDNVPTIVSPIDDTPAFRAGIQAWDRIIKIDGEATRDVTLMEAVKKMRGKPGTSVTLTIARKDVMDLFDVKLTRAIIFIKSVSEEIIGDDIGYIRIKRFSKSAGEEVKEAIAKIERVDSIGLILDLRNNPGGLLNQAVAVAENFVKKKSLIVYTKGKVKAQNLRLEASSTGTYLKKPVVVLVNEGSASASEIVAGALQDLKRAIVLGTTSFGKGSVQTIIPLSDGALRLTTALYYTPADRVIQGVGITPDIIVEKEFTSKTKKVSEEKSKELEEAEKKSRIVHIREKDLKNHLEGKGKKEKYPKEKKKYSSGDRQKDRAVELIRGLSLLTGLSR